MCLGLRNRCMHQMLLCASVSIPREGVKLVFSLGASRVRTSDACVHPV